MTSTWQCAASVRKSLLALLLLLACLIPSGPAVAQSLTLEELRHRARVCEQGHDWLEACLLYDDLLHRDRNLVDARQGYQRCLRRLHLVRRHRDPLYHQLAAQLTPTQALDLYEQVLQIISTSYVNPDKVSLSRLFQQGLRELEFALEESVFRRMHLSDISPEILVLFQARLESWPDRKIVSRSQARDQVQAIVRSVQKEGISVRPALFTILVLEFVCGACNALDEHTLFVPPGYSSEMQGTLRGQLVSVGVDLAITEDQSDPMERRLGLEIVRVSPRSPASESGLHRHDRLLRINGRSVQDLTPEDAAERLRGESGSFVEVEVVSPNQMPRTIKLERRPLIVPSVEHELQTLGTASGEMIPLGLLRISSFQETTVQEVKEALASLQTDGMRLLILDLRGNRGGLFHAAVKVAELFLGEGTVVVGRSRLADYNRAFKSDAVNPLRVPTVALIDGETASAAEVLAGALQGRGRATLVGQTTFGKGSIQCLIALDKWPLDRVRASIRLTVAKLFSPGMLPYDRRGVHPDLRVDPDGEGILREAKRLLLEMLPRM